VIALGHPVSFEGVETHNRPAPAQWPRSGGDTWPIPRRSSSRRSTRRGVGELHVRPLRRDLTAAGEARHIAVVGPKPENATWLPDGDEILFSNGLISGSAHLWRLSASGDGRSVRLPFVGDDGVMPTVSRPQPGRSARLVYVRSFSDENIWRLDTTAAGAVASGPAAVAIASTKADLHPQVSPNGRRVAFTSTRSGSWEIWVSDPDGATPVQLTSLAAPTGTGVPHWSPDGQWIVFASDVDGQFDIFVLPSAGGKHGTSPPIRRSTTCPFFRGMESGSTLVEHFR